MKLCKICNNQIKDKRRKKYCRDECMKEGKKIANREKSEYVTAKHKKQKETWKHEIVELHEIKHDDFIPINQIGLSNAESTYLKQMIREENLKVEKVIKFKRIDNFARNFTVIVVTPEMIKILFDKKYELYKSNFRLDCLRTVKYLAKAFDIVNNWDKVTQSNIK